MNVSPITSQTNSTNFKSKLPPINYKYTNGYKDYWNEFAEQCFKEGTGSRLKSVLDNIVVKQSGNKTKVNCDIGLMESDSLATVILRALENIIDPIMPANRAIFGNKRKASAQLISEFRA